MINRFISFPAHYPDKVHYIWNTNPDFILGMNPLGSFCAWPIWAESTHCPKDNTVISVW